MFPRIGLLAGVGILFFAGSGFGEDTFRLGGTAYTGGTVQPLDYDGQAVVEPVHFPAARFAVGVAAGGVRLGVGAGVRLAVGGVRLAVGAPYYWGGYYRPYYWGGPYYTNYRPYNWSGYYRPYYWTSYRPWVVYSSPVYYSTPVVSYYSYPSTSYYSPTPPPMPPADVGNGTYRYDGGPVNPLPLPGADPKPAPQNSPPKTIPLNGRIASAKPAPYLAYGETNPISTKTASLPPLTETQLVSQSPRLVYPAYGELNPPSSNLKTVRTAQVNR